MLHLITGLGVGGAETMLTRLVADMDRSRFVSSVVSMTAPGAMAAKIIAAGVPVYSLGVQRGSPHPSALAKLVALVRSFRPDILQSWMYHANILGLAAARLTRVPKLIWNIRCSDLDFPNAGLSLRTVFATHGLLSRFTDATVVNSAAGLHFHRTHGHRPQRWELIQNGFDLSRFRADDVVRRDGRAELGLKEDQIAIGMVARFDRYKDHRTFIEAAGMLHTSEPRAIFVFAGKGLTAKNYKLMELLSTAGLLAHTRLLGEYTDPSRLLPCLDIATLCSFTEGFPNVVGEAMGSEVPCVCTDVGDAELLLGPTGFVVPARDPQAVVKRWIDLIALGAEGRRALGAAARARIQERFSLPSVISAYESLYAGLASGNTCAIKY